MDEDERKVFAKWVDNSPPRPAGTTYLELWNIKKIGKFANQKSLGEWS